MKIVSNVTNTVRNILGLIDDVTASSRKFTPAIDNIALTCVDGTGIIYDSVHVAREEQRIESEKLLAAVHNLA